jgi:hypothetical protein
MKKSYALFVLALVSLFTPLSGQLVVSQLNGSQQLGSLLAGVGISISNVTITCDTLAVGTFNGVLSNVGINAGLALSTGSIFDLSGPNNLGSKGLGLGRPGDPDMDIFTMNTTFDACILEFDFVPIGDTLLFNYVFGSEEYPEFVSVNFNDGFAMWLSGPGYPTPTNVAMIPGTSTPVTVNNVNAAQNMGFYIDNGDGFSLPQSADTTVIQFDGFTTNMTSISAVVPGGNYHLKIGVADATDAAFDTGVFLQAGSFRTAGGAVNALLPKQAGLQIFPNPSDGHFQAILSNGDPGCTWVVYDVSGKAVLNGEWDATLQNGNVQRQAVGTALPSGLYRFVVQGGEAVLNRSFIVR